jgi:hypothetical protein
VSAYRIVEIMLLQTVNKVEGAQTQEHIYKYIIKSVQLLMKRWYEFCCDEMEMTMNIGNNCDMKQFNIINFRF